MSVSVAVRDAVRLHAVLEEKLALSNRFEGEAFVVFAEIMHRELFRDLDCGSIQHYAEERLGFSPSKTAQFVRLAKSFETLPRLFEAMRTGRLPWTKARVVAGVATRETEWRWIEEALASSRRALSRKIDLARAAARQRARAQSRQEELPPITQATRTTDADPPPPPGSVVPVPPSEELRRTEEGAGRTPDGEPGSALPDALPGRSCPLPPEPVDVPLPVTFRFTSEQFARYHALVEALRKSGRREPREELLLASLADALDAIGSEARAGHADHPAPASGSKGRHDRARRRRATSGVRYRIVTYVCEQCGRAHVPTSRGERPVSMAELEAQLGAAEIHRPGKRKRQTIPKGVRERVIERDGHRCQCAGCTNSRFLDVHHRTPLARGGTNDPDNLITLCHSCHRALHEREAKHLQQHTRVQNLRAELGASDDPMTLGGIGGRSP